jgi:hypothetical protein
LGRERALTARERFGATGFGAAGRRAAACCGAATGPRQRSRIPSLSAAK